MPNFRIDWQGRGDPEPEVAAPVITHVERSPDGATTGVVATGDCTGLPGAVTALSAHGMSLDGGAQLVYLDPPYNRGGRFDAYDDNMPRGDWLGSMERTLHVARGLLAVTGTCWVHLDDSEAHRVRCLLDEIFGVDAFIADITVESNPKGRQLDRFFAGSHDRLMVYARDPRRVTLRSGLPESVDPADFPLVGPDGVNYRLLPLRNTNKKFNPRTTPTMSFPIYGDPDTGRVCADPAPGLVEITPVFGDLSPAVWRWSSDRVRERADELVCRVVRGRLGERVDVYQRDTHFDGRVKKLRSIWLSQEVGSTDSARLELKRAGVDSFATPKPIALLERVIRLATDPDDLVVDLFAGSGTSAVASVHTGRRWLVVERNEQTVKHVLLPRLAALPRTRPGDDPSPR